MLNQKQIEEIREHLEKAQNPVFYYDNDADGLCSFLLLRKFIDRGKGVAARSYPDLDAGYARKAQELKADYVFVLDKPVIGKEFLEVINELGLPLVWIDHHGMKGEDIKEFEKNDNFHVYDWARNSGDEKSDEPVTYWSYKISGRKEDLWIAMMGCIADHYLPDFVSEFKERYGEYWSSGEIKDPFDAYYGTDIGRMAIAIGFGLKDSTTHIVQLQNFLISVKGPDEVFSESKYNYNFRRKNEDIKKKYDALLEKAKESIFGEVIFFEYSGMLSISSEISNELSYLYPNKYICVAFKKGLVSNLSLRGDGVRVILERMLKKFEDSSGGGHEDAVGARIKTEDLGRFKKVLMEEVGKND
tara:strand:+ start:1120 stop:2193 length:1074 start_codon:yes stop_codon:yes gene_type:complete